MGRWSAAPDFSRTHRLAEQPEVSMQTSRDSHQQAGEHEQPEIPERHASSSRSEQDEQQMPTLRHRRIFFAAMDLQQLRSRTFDADPVPPASPSPSSRNAQPLTTMTANRWFEDQ